MQVKLKDGSLRYVNPRIADMQRALRVVSEMHDMGHDVFFTRSDRNIKAHAYRGQWHETGTRESDRSVRVAGRTCSVQPEYVEERYFWFMFFTFRFLEQIKEMMVRAASVDHPN